MNDRKDERRSSRASVLLTGSIEWEGSATPVRLANLSATGALLFGDALPAYDQRVVVCCNGIRITGRVSRAGARHVGVDFDKPVNPSAFVPKRWNGADAIVKDERELEFRRPGFRGNQLTVEERQILAEWKREQEARKAE